MKSKVIAFSAKELERRKKLEDKKDPSEEEEGKVPYEGFQGIFGHILFYVLRLISAKVILMFKFWF